MKAPQRIGARLLDVETRPNGVVIVSVPLVPALGYASSAPIVAVCAVCRRKQPATVSEVFTAWYQRVATHDRIRPMFGSVVTCTACAKKP
jgi:ABC-type Fe2+-enterobactin transport system substrate-binding protein